MRHTNAQIQWIDGYKPLCLWCQVPCDSTSRTYRATRLCEFCYDDQPIILEHKEILTCQTSSAKAER